jgi:hypothetical protein
LSLADVKKQGLDDMAKFFKHQLFLAGLHQNLREKVLEAKKDTFFESLDLAHEIEAIQQDHCWILKITAIKAKMELNEDKSITWESLTEEEIKQVAAIQACKNCYLPKKKFGRLARNKNLAKSNGPRNPNVVCCCCQKKLHMQKECNSSRWPPQCLDGRCQHW